MAGEIVPYLNVSVKIPTDKEGWGDAPDQGLLGKKGGRGFPFCAIMDASGEVLWEANPQSKKSMTEAMENAKLLQSLWKQQMKNPEDAGLKASVTIMIQLGWQQRGQPKRAVLEAAAKVEGIDAKVLAVFNKWRINDDFQQAFRAEDGGTIVYKMFKAGKTPEKGTGTSLIFGYYGAKGAIKAKDVAAATTLCNLFEAEGVAMNDPRMTPKVKADAAKLREEIKNLTP